MAPAAAVGPSFTQSNPRNPSPELEDSGNLIVASFNVLNYFNGDGMGGGFPTARGADDAEELSRQTAKLVSAITALNADIVGVMEIENDGYGDSSAIAQLADSSVVIGPTSTPACHNSVATPSQWAFSTTPTGWKPLATRQHWPPHRSTT